MPGDEATGQQRPAGDRQPEDRGGSREVLVDVGARAGGVDRVDVPGLERAGVEGAEDASEHRRDDEGGEGVGDQERNHCGDIGQRGGDEDRAATEGVREAGGRQLQDDDRDAHDGRGRERLRQGQAALELPQDEQPDDEADRQPAGRRQGEEDPTGGEGGEWIGHRDSHAGSSSAGKLEMTIIY